MGFTTSKDSRMYLFGFVFYQPNMVPSAQAPSAGVEQQSPGFLVAFPESSPPLLVSTEDSSQTIWLPENPEKDFSVMTNPKNGKPMLCSPSLGYSKYVSGHNAWISGKLLPKKAVSMGKLNQNLACII